MTPETHGTKNLLASGRSYRFRADGNSRTCWRTAAGSHARRDIKTFRTAYGCADRRVTACWLHGRLGSEVQSALSSTSSIVRRMTIFVSIAAYRDPELAPTIRDCICRARSPGDLRFGICWQHADDEPAPPDFADPRLRVLDVPWHDSRGACWARAEIMKLWDGEDFFLQIDSHHRF